MAIKDPLMFITIEEFKNWKGFNKSLFDEVTTPDSEIRYAIEIASSNIDFLSGFTISKKWPEINPTKFTDNIQTATTHYVNFLLGKGVEYARGQASIGQGGITYSQNNPEDPYYIVPQVFNYLKEINEYPIMQGFNLDVSSKQNWFKKFMGNGGEQNPWEIYLQTLNLKSSDPRTKIKITHPKNIMGSVLDIDTNGIKSFDNFTTLDLFTKYFSKYSMQLVDGKKGQEKKVISISDEIGKLIENKQPLLTKDNFGDNMIVSSSGKDIKINANGGGLDPTKYYTKQEVDKEIKETKEQFQFAFLANAVGQEIPNLETTAKTIVDAINELKAKIKDKKFSSDYFKYDTVNNEVSLNDKENSLLCKDLLENNEYKILKTQNKKLLQAINEIFEKQPQPSPSKENWKKVADVFCENNKDWITYNCKSHKKYKIWYNVSPTNCKDSSEHTFMSQEFVYSYNHKDPLVVVIVTLYNQSLKLEKGNLDKFGWDNNSYGNLWKLEELQE